MGRPTAIVPVKSLATAKGRLAPVLSPPARAALVERMLIHVLGVLDAAGIGDRLVATGDRTLAALAEGRGAAVFDPGTDDDLNAAVSSAVRSARSGGADAVMLLAADLPWLSAADLGALLAGTDPVVIGEAEDGGTNALLLAPGTTLPFAFATGTASAGRHAALAGESGLGVRLLRRPGLARDIDTPADLARLLAEHPAFRDFAHAA